MSSGESIRFFSDGQRLDGELAHAEGDRCRAVVIPCSGYLGLRALQPARFARALAPRAYACISFDYRGFGFSDGERGRVIPAEQVEDIRAAVDYAASAPATAGHPILLLGWGLGGSSRHRRGR